MNTSKFLSIDQELYEYRVKRTARVMVFYAVEEGTLIRPSTCEICNNEHEMNQAHHTNYGDPLNVTWCCPPCHAKIHADKTHPLNPVNHEQTILSSVRNGLAYREITVTIPLENFILIKDRSERYGIKIDENISRTLRRANPLRIDQKEIYDYACEQHIEGISSMVSNEAKLPQSQRPRTFQSRSEGNNFRSTMERFYSVSARYEGDADQL